MQFIPEGAGTVKTPAWLFFRLFASFLILAGASKWASGSRLGRSPTA